MPSARTGGAPGMFAYRVVMTQHRGLAAIVIVTLSVWVLSACSVTRGPADREDSFTSGESECTAQWWLGDLAEGEPEEARTVAEEALAEADVTDADIEEWVGLLSLAQTEEEAEDMTQTELERQAYVEAVREHVREELEGAGFPDSDRVIEVYSDLHCS